MGRWWQPTFNVGWPLCTFQWMREKGIPHPTMNKRWAQAMADAIIPQSMLSERCAQAKDDAGNQRIMSPRKCCFSLADVACLKSTFLERYFCCYTLSLSTVDGNRQWLMRIGLGLSFLSLADVTFPIHTRNWQCYLLLADASLALWTSTTDAGSPKTSRLSTVQATNNARRPHLTLAGHCMHAKDGAGCPILLTICDVHKPRLMRQVKDRYFLRGMNRARSMGHSITNINWSMSLVFMKLTQSTESLAEGMCRWNTSILPCLYAHTTYEAGNPGMFLLTIG